MIDRLKKVRCMKVSLLTVKNLVNELYTNFKDRKKGLKAQKGQINFNNTCYFDVTLQNNHFDGLKCIFCNSKAKVIYQGQCRKEKVAQNSKWYIGKLHLVFINNRINTFKNQGLLKYETTNIIRKTDFQTQIRIFEEAYNLIQIQRSLTQFNRCRVQQVGQCLPIQ